MIKNRLLLSTFVIGLLSGCQWYHDDKLQQVVVESRPDSFQAMEVTNPATELTMTVRHMVTNNDISVECYVPGFEFTKGEGKSQHDKKGYLKISVDHQKPFPVYKAAFVIKDLAKGNHHIRVSLVDINGEKIDGLEKQFFVQVR